MAQRKLTEEIIQSARDDLVSGRWPTRQTTLSDAEQPGLRVIVRDTGMVTYHVQYEIGDHRPYIKIGNFPEMKLSVARDVVKTIRALAESGIDPFGQLHEQRVSELLEKGAAWRPGGA